MDLYEICTDIGLIKVKHSLKDGSTMGPKFVPKAKLVKFYKALKKAEWIFNN